MIIIIIVIIAIIIFFVPSETHGGYCCSLASYGAVRKVNGIQNHSLDFLAGHFYNNYLDLPSWTFL